MIAQALNFPTERPLATDRALVIPPGHLVRTGYVPMHRVRLGCTARMALGDLEAPYRRRLQLGASQPWPPPVGEWEDDADGARTFVVHDGRHDVVAALCAGVRVLLVAWMERAEETR